MFEILMFLFENYMNGSVAIDVHTDAITVELEKIGFDPYEIDQALLWLEGLLQIQTAVHAGSKLTELAIRHYLPEESERLGTEGRGLLMYLEQLGILDPYTREIVIDRIMALDQREIGLGQIKWVVLIVLFNNPDKKSALSVMQAMVLADAFDVLH